AFPFMSAFIIWILSVTGSIAAFRKARQSLKAQKYLVGITFVIAAVVFAAFAFINYNEKAEAAGNYVDNSFFEANNPIGQATGMHPGRVVWVHNPAATNEDGGESADDPFFAVENNDQLVIQDMFDKAILKLSSEKAVSDAWDGIFQSFNLKKHGIEQTYQAGQTIFVKINEGTSSWAAEDDMSPKSWYNPSAETTPFTVHALLTHLVNEVGVEQSDIYIGDPRSHVWKHTYDYLTQDFPDVNYVDKHASKASYGRYIMTETTDSVVVYSDKGTVMKGAVKDKLFVEMAEADYLISLAALKAHARAGITLTTKNHFGSHTRDAASHLHPSLVAPENDTPIDVGDYPTVGYNKYRVFVDIMGHEMLGGNTLLFFIDGLWGGPEATQPPGKFSSMPFNNDWSSSLIISQDPVALESVCFDILRYEYNNPDDTKEYRPHMFGATDYLRQAADPANWPEGITYDPEGDGTPIGSLGIHEHWNSYLEKQYTRNLGYPLGIELLTVPEHLAPSFPFVARKVEQAPAIDGDGSDAQWADSPWYPINHTWIEYGEDVPESDFNAQFKVIWSEADNALHYLVKVQDDVFIDGYEYPNTGYPNYDIVEVFIDEDRSGGDHVFDDSNGDAENAFSYHIAADAPADGEVTNTMVAADIAGTSWGDRTTANYADHFPAFAMKKNGNEFIYEFTMAVYSDQYDPADKEASRVILESGKIMGMSVAYCDNDEDDGQRDNFFGSVYVTEEAYNDHWKLADDYGKLALGDLDGTVPFDKPQNEAPVAEATVDSYVIQAIGENETVVEGWADFFSDPDGDNLDYSLSTSDDLVRAFFYGDEIRVRASEGFSGTATVTITATDGIDQTSISFEVSYTGVFINKNVLNESLRCYPNPVTSGFVTLNFEDSGYGEVNISILNLNGQLIKQIHNFKSSTVFESRIDLTDLEKGLYLLEVKYNGDRAVVRLTK
ncbi:MAG: DUF362 domain-containing protein, partial [bacterium]